MTIVPKTVWRASIAALLFAVPACSTSEPRDPEAKVTQAEDYACARFMAFDPSECDRDHCDANGSCARLYAECAESGGLSNFGHTLEGDICNCTTACTTNMPPPPPPPPPPCVPTCNNNCGGGDGCGGTCPTDDYCLSCGTYSRCANYYCGDCPSDPCNGDGCNESCCGSSTYWCCDAFRKPEGLHGLHGK